MSKITDLQHPEIRQHLLSFIYEKLGPYYEDNKALTSLTDVEIIRGKKYVAQPKITGVRSWIIFCKYDDNFISVDFPMTTNKDKLANMTIHLIDIRARPKIYNGTIMTGIYYVDNKEKHLSIDDVLIYAGENILLKNKSNRIATFQKNMKDFIQMTMTMTCNPTYELTEDGLTQLYESLKDNRSIKSLIFSPKTHGPSIYEYRLQDSDLVDDNISVRILVMKKTKQSDVYHLYDGKTKIGLAHVDGAAYTKKYNNWFKNAKKTSLLVECQNNEIKNMWIPIKVIED